MADQPEPAGNLEPGRQHDADSQEELGQTLGRLARHGAQILFFIGLEWLIRLALHATGLAHEWWAPIALVGTAVMFLIGLFVIGGSELIGDCAAAVRIARSRVRRR
jgi:hypothetical protein